MYVYHYYARQEDEEEIQHCDGIAQYDRPITTAEDYILLRRMIAEKCPEYVNEERLFIVSLSLIFIGDMHTSH